MPMVMDRLGSSTVMTGKRAGIVGVGQRLPDGDVGHTGHGSDLPRTGLGGVDPVEGIGHVELGDLGLLDGAVELAPGHRGRP